MKRRSWSGSGSSYNSDYEDEDEDDVEMDDDEKPTKGNCLSHSPLFNVRCT